MKRLAVGVLSVATLCLLSACAPKSEEPSAPSASPEAEQTEPVSPSPEVSPSDSRPAEPVIGVQFADDDLLAEYPAVEPYIDVDSSYSETVIFSTDTPFTDFKFVEVTYLGEDGDGKAEYEITEELCALKEWTPQAPFITVMEFEGVLPNRGITYTTANGVTKCFAVQTSGENGDPMLIEFAPHAT